MKPLQLYYPRILFQDRHDAGVRLARELEHYKNSGAIIMAIPRGGVAVASPVARELLLSLDVLVVRKIPIPGNPEMGMGAITSDGALLVDEELVRELGISSQTIERIAQSVKLEMQRREKLYRGDRPSPVLSGNTVILVDDGLATGYTMLAAIKSARGQKASKVAVAIPVASSHSLPPITAEADEFITLAIQEYPSFAVASFYREWTDMADEEVLALLAE